MTSLFSGSTLPAMRLEEAGERFTPLSHESLSERAYQEIRLFLMRGKLKPGQRLVSRVLAAELGISTTPVREALWRLASEQAIELDRRNTAFVPVLTSEGYEEIRDLRVQLEGFGAMKAATFASPSDIDELVDFHERHVAAESECRLDEALEQNECFHFALCRLARLPTLNKLVEMLWSRCGPLLNHIYAENTPIWKTRSQHPHLKIIDALRRRDGNAAREAITEDIMEGAKPILAKLCSTPLAQVR